MQKNNNKIKKYLIAFVIAVISLTIAFFILKYELGESVAFHIIGIIVVVIIGIILYSVNAFGGM